MWRREDLTEENPQLLTLVHGVDRKGRPVIRAFTGNARHPVYQEYHGVINKHYQKASRLTEFSRNIAESPYGVNNSSSDYFSDSGSPSTPRTRVTPRWAPFLSGNRSSTIIPELKGMREMVSRLRCSLAIHGGFGPVNNELNFLPVIPTRCRKPPTADCPKKGGPKVKSATNKQDLERDPRKECLSAPQSEVVSYNTERYKGCKGVCSKIKKTKKRKKKKASHPEKLKPMLKPIKDIDTFKPISSNYLLS